MALNWSRDGDFLAELRRLNDNFERLLTHLHVPSASQTVISGPVYVGEPATEAEMAVREHAIITGREMRTSDDEPV